MESLLFSIENHHYACDISDIDEILQMAALQGIAHGPDFLMGLFTLRGNVFPVVDLSHLLGHQREIPPPPIAENELALSPYRANCRLVLVKLNTGPVHKTELEAPQEKGREISTEKKIAVIMDGWRGVQLLQEEERQDAPVDSHNRPPYLGDIYLTGNNTLQLLHLKKILDQRQIAALS